MLPRLIVDFKVAQEIVVGRQLASEPAREIVMEPTASVAVDDLLLVSYPWTTSETSLANILRGSNVSSVGNYPNQQTL